MDSNHSHYRIEQLGHLGLPNQIFIPALLQALHHEIPSISNSFIWLDEQRNQSNIYDELHNNLLIESLCVMSPEDDTDSLTHAFKFLSALDKATTTHEQIDENSSVSELYNSILLPLGYFNSCFVPVFNTSIQQCLGILMVHRSESDYDFSDDERQILQSISTIVLQSLTSSKHNSIRTSDGWEQGLLIVDDDCKIQYSCEIAQKLLTLASSSTFDRQINQISNDMFVFNGVDRLVKNLLRDNKPIAHRVNPTLTASNAWGEFKLKGFLIKDKAGHRTDQIGLNIRWQEPFVLKLFHRIKTFDLTPRQETVALLYAAGDQLQMIAFKLNLSIHTVKEHIKNISSRLNTHSRADLIELILCDTTSTK